MLSRMLCFFGVHRPTGSIEFTPVIWMQSCPCRAWWWALDELDRDERKPVHLSKFWVGSARFWRS